VPEGVVITQFGETRLVKADIIINARGVQPNLEFLTISMVNHKRFTGWVTVLNHAKYLRPYMKDLPSA
jgi:predicted methyltransferase MtxX (methanogen marker protein 4)